MALLYAAGAFTPEEKARDFAYYERLTVRDSSLSACIQAVVAAEVGHVELAYDYVAEAALIDLDDLAHDTRDGIHIASLAGSCIAAIAGFGGLRDRSATLGFIPRLPEKLTRLAFAVRCGEGTKLRVEVEPTQATYTLLMGNPLEIHHHGQPITVTGDHPAQCPIAGASPRAAYAASRSRTCVDAMPARVAGRCPGCCVSPSPVRARSGVALRPALCGS
jgi:alpha,alpha-trehalose phosphorylase